MGIDADIEKARQNAQDSRDKIEAALERRNEIDARGARMILIAYLLAAVVFGIPLVVGLWRWAFGS
jgi:hypothetical protein